MPAEVKMRRFRLKKGLHQVGNNEPDGVPAHVYRQGDVIETEQDLVEMCGSEKFEEVHGNTSSLPGPSNKDTSDSPGPSVPSAPNADAQASADEAKRANLSDKTVQQLKDYAAENDIALGDAHLKAEIIEAIINAERSDA